MIKPINGVVVLKKVEEDEQTYGQIVIPDMGKERPEIGIVVSTSKSYNWNLGEYVENSVSEGDLIIIPKMGAMVVSHEGEDYILIKETDILGILKK